MYDDATLIKMGIIATGATLDHTNNKELTEAAEVALARMQGLDKEVVKGLLLRIADDMKHTSASMLTACNQIESNLDALADKFTNTSKESAE